MSSGVFGQSNSLLECTKETAGLEASVALTHLCHILGKPHSDTNIGEKMTRDGRELPSIIEHLNPSLDGPATGTKQSVIGILLGLGGEGKGQAV